MRRTTGIQYYQLFSGFQSLPRTRSGVKSGMTCKTVLQRSHFADSHIPSILNSKSEYRNSSLAVLGSVPHLRGGFPVSKYETNSNYECFNVQNKQIYFLKLIRVIVSVIRIFVIRYCFEFRASYFEFLLTYTYRILTSSYNI